MDKLEPVHPGSVLQAEFMAPLALDAQHLAEALAIRLTELRPLLTQTGSLTAELALRLARYFGTTPEFWLNLQQAYDLAIAQDAQEMRIASEVSPFQKQH